MMRPPTRGPLREDGGNAARARLEMALIHSITGPRQQALGQRKVARLNIWMNYASRHRVDAWSERLHISVGELARLLIEAGLDCLDERPA